MLFGRNTDVVLSNIVLDVDSSSCLGREILVWKCSQNFYCKLWI